MLLSDLILTEKRAEPVIAYHGTSSTFLRSIMKNGLQPYPEEKVWADDPHASATRTSRASYGGTYFTRNLMTAVSASTNATRKFKGNSLMVIASIVPESGLPDEDDFRYELDSIINKHFYPLDINGPMYAGWFKANPDSKELNKKIDEAFDAFSKSKEAATGHLSRVLFRRAVILMLTRTTSFNKIDNSSRVARGYYTGTKELVKDPYGKDEQFWRRLERESYAKAKQWLNKLDSSKLEKQTSEAIDKLTKRHKGYAKIMRTNEFSPKMRILQPVGFKGRNRITGIIENTGYADEHFKTKYVLQYGSVPEDFINQTFERVGPFIMYDRSGKVIIDKSGK